MLVSGFMNVRGAKNFFGRKKVIVVFIALTAPVRAHQSRRENPVAHLTDVKPSDLRPVLLLVRTLGDVTHMALVSEFLVFSLMRLIVVGSRHPTTVSNIRSGHWRRA